MTGVQTCALPIWISFVNQTNTTDDDIPYTGVEDSLPFLMVGIIILAIVFYIKIERINKELK